MICFSFWRQRVVNHDMDANKMVVSMAVLKYMKMAILINGDITGKSERHFHLNTSDVIVQHEEGSLR